MKSKSARLRPVEKIAEDKAKSATEAMVTARNDHQSHEQKLADLMQYRSEYIEQFQVRGKSGISSGHLQQYQQFIAQLDKAIEQQQQILYRSKQNLEHKQNHWQDKNSHKKAINKAVDRFMKIEAKGEDKKEQQELDEHNTQSHYRKK